MEVLPFCHLTDEEFHRAVVLADNTLKLNEHKLKNDLLKMYKGLYQSEILNDYMTIEEFNSTFAFQTNLPLTIMHLNIQSLNAKITNFCDMLINIDVNFDVIVLTEIWCTNINFYENILAGYTLIYDLPNGGKAGGVGVFIKNDLTYKRRLDLHIQSNDFVKTENVWIEVIINRSKIVIGGVYRHPSRFIDEFNEQIEQTLSKINNGKYQCIVCGDINIDLLKLHSNPVAKYLDTVVANSFLPALFLPTRITSTSATLIDHIYVNNLKKEHFDIHCGNLLHQISDHLPNFIVLKETQNKRQHVSYDQRPYIRLFSTKNKQIFGHELSKIDWKSLFDQYPPNDVDSCYNIFIDTITDIFEKSFPLTRISRRAFKDKKWFTKSLRENCNKKNKLYKNWLKSKSDADLHAHKEFCKIYNDLVKQAKCKYYKDKLNSKTEGIKNVWKNINSLINNNSSNRK